MYGATPLSPVNVITAAFEFWQTLEFPEIVALGAGFTVTVKVKLLLQVLLPDTEVAVML